LEDSRGTSKVEKREGKEPTERKGGETGIYPKLSGEEGGRERGEKDIQTKKGSRLEKSKTGAIEKRKGKSNSEH